MVGGSAEKAQAGRADLVIGTSDDLADIRVLIGFVIVVAARFQQDDFVIALGEVQSQSHAGRTRACDAYIAAQIAIAVITSKVPYHIRIPIIDQKS